MNPDQVKYRGVQAVMAGLITAELWDIRANSGGHFGWATIAIYPGQDRDKTLEARKQEFCRKCKLQRPGCPCG